MGNGFIPGCLVFMVALSVLPTAATAQGFANRPAAGAMVDDSPPRGSSWLPGSRTYLGLTLGRSQTDLSCSAASLLCDRQDRSAQLYAGTMIGNFWGVELGYIDMGRAARAGSETRAQGLNLSLIGRARVANSLGVFGKVGTTYGRTETSSLGAGIATASGQGFGLSYGAGLSFDFTPRLSATLEWDSNDLRFGGGRDPVRSTSLGLQFRY